MYRVGETSYLKEPSQELFSKERTALILHTVCLEFEKWVLNSKGRVLPRSPTCLVASVRSGENRVIQLPFATSGLWARPLTHWLPSRPVVRSIITFRLRMKIS